MLVVEEKSGNWGHLIKCIYGSQLEIRAVTPGDLTGIRLDDYKLVFIQYCKPCVESWCSLFDKNGFRPENLGTALLNAPQDEVERSWCQEFGIQGFVNDLQSLTLLIDSWKNKLPSPPSFGSLSDEMMHWIPWSELDAKIQ